MIGLPAPELEGLTGWQQSTPLKLSQLRGKVIALEFWTHGCSYCAHAAPRLQKLYDTYGTQGFQLVGVHTPEFEAEKNVPDIKKFLMHNHITYPVALDHDAKLWAAYSNQYWPTLHLIDKQGVLRHTHVGDGGYVKIAQDIEHLLAE